MCLWRRLTKMYLLIKSMRSKCTFTPIRTTEDDIFSFYFNICLCCAYKSKTIWMYLHSGQKTLEQSKYTSIMFYLMVWFNSSYIGSLLALVISECHKLFRKFRHFPFIVTIQSSLLFAVPRYQLSFTNRVLYARRR